MYKAKSLQDPRLATYRALTTVAPSEELKDPQKIKLKITQNQHETPQKLPAKTLPPRRRMYEYTD